MGQRVAYWDYIRTEELLGLQSGVAASEAGLSNDEVMFIVVHQIDELWFKLAIRELASVRNVLAQDRVAEQSLASAAHGLRRLAILFRHLSSHFELMETMTTRDYLAFRQKLGSASGFQSAQLRELEALLGLEDADRVPFGHERAHVDALRNADGSESPSMKRVMARRLDKPSLRDAVDGWLYRTPIQGSAPSDPGDGAVVARFIDAFVAAHRRETDRVAEQAVADALTPEDRTRLRERYARETEGTQLFLEAADTPADERPRRSRIRAATIFIESYRELPLLAWPREILDSLVAFEQAFVVFRQRHARMVERIIGRRTGTGGSAGVDYLDTTALRYRIFRDLWAARTVLLQKEALPPAENTGRYALAYES